MSDRKMVTVQRANTVLSVPEEWADRYLDQGYSVIDATGKIIKQSVPKDLGTLQKAYIEHEQEIEKLKATIEQLTAKKAGRPKNK